jgi:hypothetical protein
MGINCKNCDKEMMDLNLTHCSEQCVFESIKKSKKFGESENPPDYSFS